MQNSGNRTLVAIMGVALCLTFTHFASAQRGGGRGGFGGPTSRVQLVALEVVQAELKMNDEQKALAKDVSDKLGEDRRSLRGDGGDRAARLEKTAKLNAEAFAKLSEKLDDAQKKRLTEVFIQINGTRAIMDKEVSTALKVTEEQQKKLAEVNVKNQEDRREAFQDFQNMSDDERSAAIEKLTKASDERAMAVLDESQREQFGKMKGDEVEIDRSLLRRGGRGGAGGGRRGAGNN